MTNPGDFSGGHFLSLRLTDMVAAGDLGKIAFRRSRAKVGDMDAGTTKFLLQASEYDNTNALLA